MWVCALWPVISFPQVAVDEVQKWEQENPDDIDEVPIKPAEVDGRVISGAVNAFARLHDQPDQKTGADHHVQGVQAGHGEIEREEQLRVSLVGLRQAFQMESG